MRGFLTGGVGLRASKTKKKNPHEARTARQIFSFFFYHEAGKTPAPLPARFNSEHFHLVPRFDTRSQHHFGFIKLPLSGSARCRTRQNNTDFAIQHHQHQQQTARTGKIQRTKRARAHTESSNLAPSNSTANDEGRRRLDTYQSHTATAR